MPYKIVQTVEKGRSVLTAVPHQWENNGILYWPKKHEKLRRIENSLPEANWRTINCILKRSNLSNFTQAESEIDDMSNLSDTETDNDNKRITKNYVKSSTKYNNNKMDQSYNEMARKCCVQSQPQPVNENLITEDTFQHSQFQTSQNMIIINHTPPSNSPTGQPISLNNGMLTPTQENVVTVINEETPVLMTENYENNAVPPPAQNTIMSNEITMCEVLATILHKFEQVQEDIKTLAGEFKIITENQQALFQNQNNMLLKFAESQTQFEEFIHKSCGSTGNNKKPDVKPISNKKELQELELLLADPDFKAKLRNTLEVVCSKGKNRGINNAYALIDILFQRSFLCECSWAGGSRTEQSKTCLKSFTNIFDLFFSVLHDSDPDFKKPDCEKFLKTVLKNSRQRCASKQIRMSTMRHRAPRSPKKVPNGSELINGPESQGKRETITSAEAQLEPEANSGGSTSKKPSNEPLPRSSTKPSINENSLEEESDSLC